MAERGNPNWKKGESGNPGGRPKGEVEVVAIARAAGPAAIRKLVEMMDHEDPKVAIYAAEKVIDRGFGKATQMVQHSGEVVTRRANEMTDDEIAARLASLRDGTADRASASKAGPSSPSGLH